MKLKLFMIFLMACSAENEEEKPFSDYELFRETLIDYITIRNLGSYLVRGLNKVKPCYKKYKKDFEDIASNYKNNVVAAKGISEKATYRYRVLAKCTVSTMEKLTMILIEYLKNVWKEIENNNFENGLNIYYKARDDFESCLSLYYSQLRILGDYKVKAEIEKNIKEINASVEKEFKKVSINFETCVDGSPKFPVPGHS